MRESREVREVKEVRKGNKVSRSMDAGRSSLVLLKLMQIWKRRRMKGK